MRQSHTFTGTGLEKVRAIVRGTRTKKAQRGKKKFTYKNGEIPKIYQCHACKIPGQKLWRQRGPITTTTGDITKLWCMQCGAREYGGELQKVKKRQGTYLTSRGRTNEIGNRLELIPAVLEPNGSFYYAGFSTTPHKAKAWWYSLSVALDETNGHTPD